MILKSAAQQIRAARRKAEEAGENWEGPQKPETSREYDTEALAELKKKRREAGDNFKTTRRKLARNTRRENISAGKLRIEWSFEPGELVKIKNSAFRRHSVYLENMGLYAGAIGVIVEPEDDKWRSAANRVLHVMGPMGLQAWDASWVEACDDE
tara:strand:- start:2057 stop:2518 length:462 start_codon:yes stop_codon:yes gene_type:complete